MNGFTEEPQVPTLPGNHFPAFVMVMASLVVLITCMTLVHIGPETNHESTQERTLRLTTAQLEAVLRDCKNLARQSSSLTEELANELAIASEEYDLVKTSSSRYSGLDLRIALCKSALDRAIKLRNRFKEISPMDLMQDVEPTNQKR